MRALETAVGMAGREDHVTLFSVPPLLEADPQRAGARLADAVAEAYAGARERVRMSAYAAAKVAKVRHAGLASRRTRPAGAGDVRDLPARSRPCLRPSPRSATSNGRRAMR